ncbi:hypothetical protein CONLIGDRAFT_697025 [Coniochaeta ligniaria NRRL 30616]|uniref:Uncharacterized protein n=1 Tax=Coniochaeta ligniaria NRRL 30616 TaxID=1408157 RepID=A0A1J7J241_9PEZI|nr:hypothetical protein CONLIGDRAFT_697025 [Coniochaeta ligniaria NRRL 30616]
MPRAMSAAASATQQQTENVSHFDGTTTDVELGSVVSGDPASHNVTRIDSRLTETPVSPPKRRPERTNTFRTVQDFESFQVRPGWHPGAEPGVDPAKPDGGHASMPSLSAPCDITIVDICQDNLAIQHLDNDTLGQFLDIPQPEWSICRWINVNGLSWDVIKTLGQHKSLHQLAIEDIMNTRNRTKAEWFPTHAFIVLTLQKLVHICEAPDDNDDDKFHEYESGHTMQNGRKDRPQGLRQRIKRALGIYADNVPDWGKETGTVEPNSGPLHDQSSGTTSLSAKPRLMRTLQRYHGQPNDARAKFMEEHSALASRDLAVAAEQVSIFIMNDNTIISFFEMSAEDIAKPIIRRLQTPDTILRQSCDASMIGQSIVDAIIDLAIPVASCYSDVIADLELDVLTRPNITHTKRLYIIITEINKMVSFINPITNLINALRDHKTDMTQDLATKELQNPQKGVIITPMTLL